MTEKKLIWFKKPKCAGTSFENYLKEKGLVYYYDRSSRLSDLNSEQYKVICVHSGMAANSGVWKKKANGQYISDSGINRHNLINKLFNTGFDVSEHFVTNYGDFLSDNISFSIIRNPFDKFVSSWKYLKATKNLSAQRVLSDLPNKRNFHDWLHLTKSQSACVSNESMNIFVDYFVYMEENFESDLQSLLSKIGLKDFMLPHHNKTHRGSITEELSQQDIDLIYEKFKTDFELFGYSRDYETQKPINPVRKFKSA